MSEGLNAPESAYLDRESGLLFVSQVGLRPGGTPMDKDGNGVISKLTRDGKVLALNWVKDARVSRQLPDTLVIDIVEREPHAVLRRADRLVLIDATGAEAGLD